MARWRSNAAAVVGYASAAVVFTWPLGRYLTTHLPADPAGDAGVYAWNLWVFAREWGRWGTPLTTDRVFPLTGGTDLALHNYTIASNLLALPFIDALGVVAAFNVVLLVQLTLAGFGMFLLARHLTRAAWPSWVAGLAFACSPVIGARIAGHFSLVAVAPLPFFALSLLRGLRAPDHLGWAVAAGACVAWAAYSDPYYAVYCLVMLVVLVAVKAVALAPGAVPRARWRGWPVWLAVACAVFGAVIRFTGGTDVEIAGQVVYVRTAYTPMLVASAAACWALARGLGPRLRWAAGFELRRAAVWMSVLGATAAVLLSPVLWAMAVRALDGRWVSAGTLWRSSTPGLDLAALVLPNPTHAMVGHHVARCPRRLAP